MIGMMVSIMVLDDIISSNIIAHDVQPLSTIINLYYYPSTKVLHRAQPRPTIVDCKRNPARVVPFRRVATRMLRRRTSTANAHTLGQLGGAWQGHLMADLWLEKTTKIKLTTLNVAKIKLTG